MPEIVVQQKKPIWNDIKFNLSKFIRGAKRPLLTIIAYGLTVAAGQPEWAWLGAISAERLLSTIEWYLSQN